jgi:ribonuclease HII
MGQWIDEQIKNENLTAKMLYDKFQFELAIGISLFGRKYIAGPICIVAVILPPDHKLKLHPVSTLSLAQCDRLNQQIRFVATMVNISWAAPQTMLRIGRDNAIMQAINTVLVGISVYNPCDLILMDNYKMPYLPNGVLAAKIPVVNILRKGNLINDAIAAGSVVARVARHHVMQHIHNHFPEYDWRNNEGALNKQHLSLIEQYGITPHHRGVTNIKTLEGKLFINEQWRQTVEDEHQYAQNS